MRTIFIFGFMMSLAGALALVCGRKIEEAIAPAIFSVILILYLSGLVAGTLISGIYIALVLGVLSLCYIVKSVISSRCRVIEHCLTPGFFLFFVLFGWIWWINRYRLFSSWDEFSHWGLVVKNIVFLDSFGNHPESTVYFLGYPPATALWQYFIVKLYGTYYEGHVYQAVGWMAVSLMMPAAARVTSKKWKQAAFAVLFLVVVPFIFNPSYIVLLYVDSMLGILFGYLLVSGFVQKKRDFFFFLNTALGLIVLCLTKASGLFLALTAAVVLCIWEYREIKKEKRFRSALLLSGVSIGSILFGKLSWSLYLKASATAEAWNTSALNFSNVLTLFQGKGEVYQYTVIENFLTALSQKDFSSYVFQMKFVTWILVAVIVYFYLVKRIRDEERKKLKHYAVGLLAGLAVYTAGLLFLYIFTYDEYEAVRLASFQRYLSTYLIGIAVFGGGIIWQMSDDVFKDNHMIAILICTLFLFMPMSEITDVTVLNSRKVKNTVSQRQQYAGFEQQLEALKCNINNIKLSFISQNTSGFDYWQLRYLATPIKCIEGGWWSIGEPYDSDDIWTQSCTAEEWLDRLEEEACTHVYLYKIDDAFIQRYNSVFSDPEGIEAGRFFEIKTEGNKKYLLKVED